MAFVPDLDSLLDPANDPTGGAVPSYSIPDYPTDPLPLKQDQFRELEERRRQATRRLQEAMVAQMRGRQAAESAFQQSQGGIEADMGGQRDSLRGDASARNLAFQPAFMGRGFRDIRDQHANRVGSAQSERASRLQALQSAVNQARRRRGEDLASVDRDRARFQTGDLEQLMGSF